MDRLNSLEKLEFGELFGEVRECFNSCKEIFDLRRLLRACYYQILCDKDRFEEYVKPYILLNVLTLKKSNVTSDGLFYDSENCYDMLVDVLNSFDLKSFALNERIGMPEFEEIFVEADWVCGLEEIDLRGSYIEERGFETFCQRDGGWLSLETLHIGSNNMGDDVLLLLETKLSENYFPNLRYVYAEDNTFGDRSMDLMNGSDILKRLEVLDITGSMELTRENLIYYASSNSKLFQSSSYRRYNYDWDGQGF